MYRNKCLYVQKYLRGPCNSVNCSRDIRKNIQCNYCICRCCLIHHGRPKERQTYEDRLMDLAQLLQAEWVGLHTSWGPMQRQEDQPLRYITNTIFLIFLLIFPMFLNLTLIWFYHRFTWWENTCLCNKSMGSKSENNNILIWKSLKHEAFFNWGFTMTTGSLVISCLCDCTQRFNGVMRTNSCKYLPNL